MDNETMVNEELLDNDDLDEELQIEEDTPEEEESVVLEEEEEPVEETPPQRSEPGYVQKRIAKALAQERESIRAEVEAMYAPLRDRLLEMDAKELVRQGEFKSVERAKEYLQLKQGATPAPQYESEYVEDSDPGTDARIDMLAHQADMIKADGGPDVISEFQRNKEIKNKVINGEMDFYDVAKAMGNRKRPPSPMRSPNGVGGISTPISAMSDAQFAKLDKMLDEGVRFTSRR